MKRRGMKRKAGTKLLLVGRACFLMDFLRDLASMAGRLIGFRVIIGVGVRGFGLGLDRYRAAPDGRDQQPGLLYHDGCGRALFGVAAVSGLPWHGVKSPQNRIFRPQDRKR